MPRISLLTFGWLMACLAILPAQSGSVGGDVFFDGFQLWKQGEKQEQEGNKEGAIRSYVEAYRIISSVTQNYPEWQPDVVSRRLRIVETSLQRLGYNVGPAPAPGYQQAPVAPPPQMPVQPYPAAPGAPAPYAPQPGMPVAPAPVAPQVQSVPMDVINSQFQAQQRRITELEQSNAKLLQDLRIYSEGYMGAAQQRDQLRAMQTELTRRIEELTKQASTTDTAMQAELQRLRNEAKMVADMLAAKSQQAEASGREVEALKKQREAMEASQKAMEANQKKLEEELAQVKRDTVKPDDMAKIIAENTRLKKELDAARQQMEKLKGESTRKDEEILALRTQITGIQAELTKLRQENTSYQTQVAELTVKYKEMSKQLEEAEKPDASSPEAAKVAQENRALRAIIMRQLRQQERARQAKELVIADMTKLENATETLMENLEDLTAGKLFISVEEESLFTEPELREILAASGVNATLEAQSGKPGVKPGMEVPQPAPQSPSPSPTGTQPAPASQPDVPAPMPVTVDAATEESLMVQADSAILRNDYPAAEMSLQDALRMNPKNAFALTSLAGIKLRQKKYEEAEVLFQKCLVYAPRNNVALYSLGVCYFRQSKMSDALAAFEKTVANDRSNSKAHHYLGIIASNMSNRSRAEAEFKSALAIDPNYGDAHFNLAVLYATSSPPDYEKARQHYQDALTRGIKPDSALERLLKGPAAPTPALQVKGPATAAAR